MNRGGFGGRGGRGGGRGGDRGRGRGGGRGGFKMDFNKKRKPKEGKMIMFDPEKRREFITGFRKRKDERRFQAKIKAKDEVKVERKELLKSKAI